MGRHKSAESNGGDCGEGEPQRVQRAPPLEESEKDRPDGDGEPQPQAKFF